MKTNQICVMSATTLVLLCSSQVLYAEDSAPTAEALDSMEQEGFESFASQGWSKAVVTWNEVLELDPSRTHLLYFKAQALFKLGDREAARRHALRAREATPPLKESLARKNEELLGEIAKLDAQEAEQKRAQMELRAEQKQIAADVRPRASGWIWVGTGALALGGLSMAGAAWQADKLQGYYDQMAVPQTRPEYDALAEDARGHRVLGHVFLWTGVALAASGVGVIIWDLMTPEGADVEEPAAQPSAGVGVSPNGAFVRITW
jgi:hypothetical protein